MKLKPSFDRALTCAATLALAATMLFTACGEIPGGTGTGTGSGTGTGAGGATNTGASTTINGGTGSGTTTKPGATATPTPTPTPTATPTVSPQPSTTPQPTATAQPETVAKTFTLANEVSVNASKTVAEEETRTYQANKKYSGQAHTAKYLYALDGKAALSAESDMVITFVTNGTQTYELTEMESTGLRTEYLYDTNCYYSLDSANKTYIKHNYGSNKKCFLVVPHSVAACYVGIATINGTAYYTEVYESDFGVVYVYCYAGASEIPTYEFVDFNNDSIGCVSYQFLSATFGQCDASLLSLEGYTVKN